MGVRVLANRDDTMACLYCSTSDWAFGPVFLGERGGGAEDLALEFLGWLLAYRAPPGDLASGRDWNGDARRLTDAGLARARDAWLAERSADNAEERADHAAGAASERRAEA